MHPSASAISIALEDYLISGTLVPLHGRDADPYRLSDQVLNSTETIEDFFGFF